MLGAIGAATLAAHKFWPKGITYGDKEDWEHEDKSKKEKVKDKAKDVKAAITGEPRKDERGGNGNGSGSGSGSGARDDDRRDGPRGGGRGGGRDRDNDRDRDRDRSRERRERYLEERERYGRPNITKDRGDARRMALPAAAAAGAAYQEDRRRRRRDEEDGPPPPPPPPPGPDPRDRDRDRDRYDDYDPREWRTRYAENVPPPPQTAQSTFPATERRVEQIYATTDGRPPPPPPPPAAPNPPSVVSYARADPTAPVVVSTGGSRASRDPAGRYYVDRDMIVIPSRGETEFVVNRAAPPGRRLTVEKDGRIYR